jgi:hypothetical protein
MRKITALTLSTLSITGGLLIAGGQSASAKTPDCDTKQTLRATGQTWGLGSIRPGAVTLTTTGKPCRIRVTTWSILGDWDKQNVKGNTTITRQVMIHRDVVTVTKRGVTVRLTAPTCGPWQADVGKKGTVFFGGTNFGTPCQTDPVPTVTPNPTLTLDPTPGPDPVPTEPEPNPTDRTTEARTTPAPAPTVLNADLQATPVAVTRPELAATGIGGRAMIGWALILIGAGITLVMTMRPRQSQPKPLD